MPGGAYDYSERQKYPWLKGHGSIEALMKIEQRHSMPAYPWLKGHGSIEAGPDGGGAE